MRRTVAAAISAAFSLVLASESHALFHLNLIDEVMSGVGGDPTVQYVEVRVLDFQTIVANTRLTAFNCDGTTSKVLLLLGSDVTNAGTGVRLVIASTTFAAAAGITPDFTWNPSLTGNIDPTCGMVCWGAPGVVPADPGTWSATDPNQYVDCVAYGSYTGPTKTADPDADGVSSSSGTPTSLAPGNGILSLTRMTTTNDNAADFALACPSATNNTGATANFGPCPPASTTTTTATTSSSSTALVTTTTTPTTSTTPGAVCGNGILEPGEQCDPPWSRKPEQCPPLPGRRFGPECGDDCRCVTTTTSTATTATSPTTTTTSSTSSTTEASTTTTTAPRQDIQCCITRSPDPAFPEGVSCEFLKPFECDAFGGVNMGPGDCEPNPCLGTTTTTLSGLSGLSCARSATTASVECRLAKLIATVSEAGDMHGLGTQLLGPLHRAEAHMRGAAQLEAHGQSGRARAFLRRAAHDLRTFGKRLRSRRAARLLPAPAREVMRNLADPLGLDLRVLAPAAGR